MPVSRALPGAALAALALVVTPTAPRTPKRMTADFGD
jgi:hypothetical protein